MLSTHLCASSASITWILLDWWRFGKPSVLGGMTGMVAGLGVIAGGAGFITPMAALIVGVVAGIGCFYSIQWIKYQLQIDDALDVFPVHGISGIIGILLTGIFAAESFGGIGLVGSDSMLIQTGIQLLGILVTMAWSGLVSFIGFKSLEKTVGLRVSDDDEISGLDIALHDQQGYNL